jgi:uncharacterized membrane protein
MTTNLIGHSTLLAGTVTTGLIGGLFFSFATAVMPGLGRASDQAFVTSMQGINQAILNPVFLTTFVAPIICLGVAVFTGPARPWVIAALVLYIATFAITMAGNVPLNDALDAVGATRDASALEAARKAFEDPWNRLHLVRTVTSIAAFACCLGALRAA